MCALPRIGHPGDFRLVRWLILPGAAVILHKIGYTFPARARSPDLAPLKGGEYLTGCYELPGRPPPLDSAKGINEEERAIALPTDRDVRFLLVVRPTSDAGQSLPLRTAKPCGQKTDVFHSSALQQPYLRKPERLTIRANYAILCRVRKVDCVPARLGAIHGRSSREVARWSSTGSAGQSWRFSP
jgi:hypothetical protein